MRSDTGTPCERPGEYIKCPTRPVPALPRVACTGGTHLWATPGCALSGSMRQYAGTGHEALEALVPRGHACRAGAGAAKELRERRRRQALEHLGRAGGWAGGGAHVTCAGHGGVCDACAGHGLCDVGCGVAEATTPGDASLQARHKQYMTAHCRALVLQGRQGCQREGLRPRPKRAPAGPPAAAARGRCWGSACWRRP